MTGNHLMLLLFRSVLSVCCGGRCRRRIQQSSLIGNPVYIRLYRLSFLVGRIGVCSIPAHNKGTPRKRSCELDHISILLNPVVDIDQGWSALWLGALHKGRDVYPSVVWLDLQLEVRPVRTRYGAGFIPALWIWVKYIFSRKENPATNRPCFNKALLSSLTELSDLRKCFCHS